MKQNVDEKSMDATLEKTDLGQVIHDNKKIFGGILVLIVLAGIGLGVYNHNANTKSSVQLSNAYDFKTQVITAYQEDKIKSDEFVSRLTSMPASIKGEESIFPDLLLALKKLAKEGNNQEVKTILSNWQQQYRDGSYVHFFISFQLSQVLQDLGENKAALDQLMALKSSPIKVLKDKILLDLARLQMENKNNEAAKANLTEIVKNYEDSQAAKEAKFYLATFK